MKIKTSVNRRITVVFAVGFIIIVLIPVVWRVVGTMRRQADKPALQETVVALPAGKNVAKETPKKTPQITQKDIKEAINFLDQLDKIEKSKTAEGDKKSQTDVAITSITDMKDKKSDTSNRTPEQQRNYEILAVLLPQYEKLGELRRDADSRYLSLALNYPPKGSDPEIFRQHEQKVISAAKQNAKVQNEETEALLKIKEYFPEAVTITDSMTRLDYRELRKAVGGSLPTDKGQQSITSD